MQTLTKTEKWIVFGLSLATIFAHLLNLGITPLMADESLRATVAWEMMARDNYTVPTIWGEFYYRKPPLYNWIIIGFFKVFGSFSEFVFRLPSVLPLFLLSIATWFVSRKHIGHRGGIVAGFAFILSGLLLTRDSMLGHIDIAFSLVTFMGFYTVYFFHKKQNFWALFLISYALAGCGVLMKGLPSFLFQGFTVAIWLIYMKDWRKLFSLSHFAGIAVFLAIVVGYFYAYSQQNSLETYFAELYGQAEMRTVVDKKWYEGILNIFTFPFENFGHLFPTSLIILFALKKGTIKRWMENDFLAFTLLTFAINIIPYWLSPGYHPRYLFMLYPLALILGAEAYVNHEANRTWISKLVEWIFLILGIVQGLAYVAVFFVERLEYLPYLEIGAIAMMLLTMGIVYLWFKQAQWRIYWSFAFIICFRIGFDMYVLPYRLFEGGSSAASRKQMATDLFAHTGKDKPIRVFEDSPIYKEHAFYLGTWTGRVIEKTDSLEPGYFYLMDQHRLARHPELTSIYHYKSYYKKYETHLTHIQED